MDLHKVYAYACGGVWLIEPDFALFIRHIVVAMIITSIIFRIRAR